MCRNMLADLIVKIKTYEYGAIMASRGTSNIQLF